MACVFLSGTFDDLKAERRVMLNVFQRTCVAPVAQEFFGAHSRYPIETIEASMRAPIAERGRYLYVLLLGDRYGSLVPKKHIPEWANSREGEVSYSEIEFDLAGRLRIPRLVYIKNTPKGARTIGQGEVDRKTRFIEKIAAERCTYCRFSTTTELGIQSAVDIMTALHKFEWEERALGPDYPS